MTSLDVIQKAIRIFPDETSALEWMVTPLPVLGMKKPSDCLQTPEGTKVVDDILNQLMYGDLP